MTSRKQLHELIDIVDASELGVLFHLLMKFVPDDVATPDEEEAILLAEEELAQGETVSHSEIDWN